jgi:choline kinase
MKAIILAAGRGSRMKGLTEHNPKCLVELAGKTLLAYQLAALLEAGITEIGIVTGYRREMLTSFGLTEFTNERWSETNMVASLSCAEKWLQEGECIVSYSDIFYHVSAITSLLETQADIAITYDPNWLDIWQNRFEDPLSDAETFRLNDDNELLEIGQQPQSTEQVQGQYMGLLKFSPKGWRVVERLLHSLPTNQQDTIHMTGMLQKVIENHVLPIKAIPYLERWGEVDSEEDLECYK